MSEKKVIFIDANVYLRFYDTSGNKFKSLLQTLVELKGNIFITQQICSEVQRNKLSVAINSFSANYKSLGIQKTSLPEHLDDKTDKKLKQWNDSRNNIIQEEKKLKKEYSQIVESKLQSIMASKDNVSKELFTIFTSAQSASPEEIVAARLRKELGNPPGKSNDPLGDQLTWEQFLTKYSNQEIWFITNDRDYLSEYSGNLYLNPYLYNELKIKLKNKSPKIKLFKSLTEGINDYSIKIATKINTLPSNAEMKVIRAEEAEITRKKIVSSNINSIGYDEETLILEIEFSSGSIYQYHEVPPEIYEQLSMSPSVGHYFHQNIRGIFGYLKIR